MKRLLILLGLLLMIKPVMGSTASDYCTHAGFDSSAGNCIVYDLTCNENAYYAGTCGDPCGVITPSQFTASELSHFRSLCPNSAAGLTTPLDWFRYIDGLSNGVYISGFLFVLEILIFFWVSGTTSDKFLTSSVIIAVLGSLLRAINMLSDTVLGIIWALVAISVFYSIFKRGD